MKIPIFLVINLLLIYVANGEVEVSNQFGLIKTFITYFVCFLSASSEVCGRYT